MGLPDGLMRQMEAKSSLRINRRNVTLQSLLDAGQTLYLSDPADLAALKSTPTDECIQPPTILYEDAHLLVASKVAGIIVHSDETDELTLDRQVAAYYQRQGYSCRVLHSHRLDKWTTGAVVYAKHGLAARALDNQLANKQMQRIYMAVTFGARWPQRSELTAAIGRDRHRRGLYRVSSTGKTARTYVTRTAESTYHDGVLSLVRCQLDTGRTHQIRVHTSHMGAPIVGDTKYGGPTSVNDWPKSPAIALHAVEVSFEHPYDWEKIVVNCPVDDGWRVFLRQEWGVGSEMSLAETPLQVTSPHAKS